MSVIHFLQVFGNHDTLHLEEGVEAPGLKRTRQFHGRRLSTTGRLALMEFDVSHPLSHSHAGILSGDHTPGPVSNFYLDIIGGSPATRLYFIDSGGGDYAAEVVDTKQVNMIFKNPIDMNPRERASTRKKSQKRILKKKS